MQTPERQRANGRYYGKIETTPRYKKDWQNVLGAAALIAGMTGTAILVNLACQVLTEETQSIQTHQARAVPYNPALDGAVSFRR